MTLQRSARRAVALTVLALAMPTAASADHGAPLLDDRLGTYFGIAQAHWGGPVPSCVVDGVMTLPVHAVLYDDPNPSVAARAEQPGCRLWVDRGYWRTMTAVEACTMVVHEWGHLLGHAHSAGRLSVMAEFPARPPSACSWLDQRPRRARASARRGRSCVRHASARRTRRHGGARRAMCVLRNFRA